MPSFGCFSNSRICMCVMSVEQCAPLQSFPVLYSHLMLAVPTGIKLLTSPAQSHRSHLLPCIPEGTSADQTNAQSSTQTPLESSVRTSGTCGEGGPHPYTRVESQYEEVFTHCVAGDMDGDAVNITLCNEVQGPSTCHKGFAASTPPRTVYTVVPVKV